MNVRGSALRGACAIGVSFALLGPCGVRQADASTVITSGGYGLFASIVQNSPVYGRPGVYGQIGEVDVINGTAPAPYSYSSSTPSFQGSASLFAPVLDISTGVLTGAASSPYPPTSTGTATFTVDSLLMTLGVPMAPPLLDISATSLTGTSSISGIGPLSTTGSSTLEDLSISGGLIGAPISLPGVVDPPANDVLFNSGSLEIIANAQGGYNNGIEAGMTTIPLEIFFNGGDAPSALGGVVDFGFSYTQISTAPEPAAWIEMLVGVGLMGAVLRRRRKRVPAPTTVTPKRARSAAQCSCSIST